MVASSRLLGLAVVVVSRLRSTSGLLIGGRLSFGVLGMGSVLPLLSTFSMWFECMTHYVVFGDRLLGLKLV